MYVKMLPENEKPFVYLYFPIELMSDSLHMLHSIVFVAKLVPQVVHVGHISDQIGICTDVF